MGVYEHYVALNIFYLIHNRTAYTEGIDVHTFHSRVSVTSDGSMRILDAQRSLDGIYTCKATNDIGSDSVTYGLRVIGECGLVLH